MPEQKLSYLLSDIPVDILSEVKDVPVTAVISDSRQVVPGCLFVAVRGSNFDGHKYIAGAVENGAAAVVGMDADISLNVPYIHVRDTRQALPYLAAAFYGNPGRKLCMIGVTGTDGKTTTTNLIFHILQAAGLKTGMVSTVNAVIGDRVFDTGFHVTTPEAVDVQRYLAMMVESGITHAVLETTSHGWAQHRVDGCEFDVAVITNITHEHLDEHGSLENYRQAKAHLFQSLVDTKPKLGGNPRTAILNRDDASYPYLQQVCAGLHGVRELTYGIQSDAWSKANKMVYDRMGVRFDVVEGGEDVSIMSRLVGAYNISNILAAYTATVGALGIEPQAAQAGIAAMVGIPGRMEAIDMGQDFLAYVDFAHTPNALQRTLETARQMTNGRVIATFGAAGLRDREKRRMMAECAVKLADLAVFTAEDPRSESLDEILAEMAKGAEATGGVECENFWRVPDRGEAIRKAMSLAQPGDVVLVCGKGHEQSMCFGEVEYAWDDRVAMRAALAELFGVAGPEMPYLPTAKR
jgi:UDP-N-acetylmuramoyl-L-alanyl-D-glutamate--2,6-diaminopimelate ligase